MLNDFDEINDILQSMADDGMVEPCDDINAHPLDWAEAAGLVEEVFGEMYPEADSLA